MPPRTAASPTPMDFFWEAPPFSRTITVLTLVLSICVYTRILDQYWVLFWPTAFLKLPPQLWRLFSCFLISGPQLGILLDPYFMYTYASKLEKSSPRFSRPADFYFYIIFLWMIILALNYLFTGAYIFTSALILALIYTACQDDRHGKATLFVVTIPATWLPLAMLLLTFVMSGTYQAKIQSTGLIAAHLHDFLTNIYPTFGGGRNCLKTPAFVERFFTNVAPGIINRSHGTAFRSGQPSQGSSTGVSTNNRVLPDSWRSRGSGHRLGGD